MQRAAAERCSGPEVEGDFGGKEKAVDKGPSLEQCS